MSNQASRFASVRLRIPGLCSGILYSMYLAIVLAGVAGCAGVVSPSGSNGGTGHPGSNPPPTALQISTPGLPGATAGSLYSASLSATGGLPPYSWSASSGALPPGLQLSAALGTITGTPTAPGTYPFTAQVLDSKSAKANTAFSISVAPQAAIAPLISGISPNTGPASGGTSVTISGANFAPGTQVQFGSIWATSAQVMSASQIQAVSPAEGSGTVGVSVQNSDGQKAVAPNAFTFVAPLQLATKWLPVGSIGANYSATMFATGGLPPYTWSTPAGALPTGLQLNSAAGVIAGVPTASGTYSFTAQVVDTLSSSSTEGLSVTISAQPAPVISNISPNTGPDAGGTAVSIHGSNFRTGASVEFGGISAASTQLVSPNQIQAVTPAESSGSVDVAVQDSDGQVATVSGGFTFTAPSSGPPVVPAPSSDPLAPKIFNFSSSARPGEVVFLQGANFDPTSRVWLAGTTASNATQLAAVNTSGSIWMAVQIPSSASGALVVWVANSHGPSKSVALNGAVPTHLDALQLVPGGAFRLLGHNLLMPGFTPVVMVNGQAATLDTTSSDENTLVLTAPTSLASSAAAVITVDNGNGTGPVMLERTISVVSGTGDPFALGVGWGAGFTFASRTINAKAACDGSQDDSANIQLAIDTVSVSGGVVVLPAGTCRVAKTINLSSHVVLKGAGKDVTILRYESNYPVSARGADLVGLSDLTLVNSGAVIEGPTWQNNSRSFLLRVKIDMGVSRQLFFTSNSNFAVAECDFIQRGSIGGQNPYLFNNSAGLLFRNNTTSSIDGSPTFQHIHDSLFLSNHFTRDASHQNETPVIATHRFVMDFSYRVSIVGNTFDVVNGPITNKTRNDGETLLTEGGGAKRTENLGTVGSATSNSITDTSNVLNVNPFGTGLPENYGVAIVSGNGAGQTREIVSYSNGTMTVDSRWDVIPDTSSHYATFVWGLEKVILKGNTLVDNPRGIWLYQTAIRDVDILDNTITNGGGIYLRSFQSVSARQFDPIYNVRIRGNSVANSTGLWMSHIFAVFVTKDRSNFGIADIGIEIANNSVTANVPNVISTTEEYAGREGYMNLMRSEISGGQLTSTPDLLGTLFQGNQCTNCSTPFIVGTGDYGTVLMNNQLPTSTPHFLSDWQTLGSSIGGSIGTVVH